MRRFVLAVFLASIFVPLTSHAADSSISRRDGFLMIWETLKRPAEEKKSVPFTDMKKGDKGYIEIGYAQSRGLIDDGDLFYPDEPLTLQQALLWMVRTRNLDDIDVLTFDRLPEILKPYDLGDIYSVEDGVPTIKKQEITQDTLQNLIVKFTDQLAKESHEVSLYSEKFHGKGTAFGESFDMYAMTAAHRTFPYNTIVKVTNIENGKSVTVRINDRGPFVKGRDMDLSLGAFTAIAERSKGKIRATFERLGDVNMQSEDVAVSSSSVSSSVCLPADEQKRGGRNLMFAKGIYKMFPLGSVLTLQAKSQFMIDSTRYPDGTLDETNTWVQANEDYTFTPSQEGKYFIKIADKNGRKRVFQMNVMKCGS
jgi:rare lipoprotein A